MQARPVGWEDRLTRRLRLSRLAGLFVRRRPCSGERFILSTPMLDGYNDLPPGKVRCRGDLPRDAHTAGSSPESPQCQSSQIRRVSTARTSTGTASCYRRIGEPWLWFSRLRMSDDELRAILHDPNGRRLCIVTQRRRSRPAGVRPPPAALTLRSRFSGVTPSADRQRAPGARCWQHCASAGVGITSRSGVWLHTCTSDHPSCAGCSTGKAGFVPYKRAIEIDGRPDE